MKKIVIADDEAHIRILLEEALEPFEDEGVELLIAEDGEQALALIQQEEPDMVFLDIMMPGIDGFEVCTRVKKELRLQMHVVILTAKGQDIDRVKGLECGADLFLTKPFSPTQLIEHTSKVLGIEV
jgi:two-component system alkaline phosphatase synthesis response regulator PhoP